MKPHSLVLPLILLAVPAWAASPVGVLVLPAAERSAVAASLVQPADFLCAIVETSDGGGDAKNAKDGNDAAVQVEDIKKTQAALAAEVAKNPQVVLYRGSVHLSPSAGGSSSSVMSFISGSYATTTTYKTDLASQVYILLKLDPENPDVLGGAALIRGILARVKAAGDAKLRLTGFSLAVDTPESRRAELLKRIGAEADASRAAFAAGAGTVTISGLESPVLVRQADESHVELFIDYHLSVAK